MGVAPRWRTLTSVPTVTYPSSSSFATACHDAFSIKAIIMGVLKTSTPLAPTAAAVFSCVTTVVDSPVKPSFNAIGKFPHFQNCFLLLYYTTESSTTIASMRRELTGHCYGYEYALC